jgi:hypothetical protein
MWRLFGLALVVVFSAGSSYAVPPPACTTPDLERSYDGGVNKGGLWWDYMLCPNFPACCSSYALDDSIVQIINLQHPMNLNAACEVGGFVDSLAALYQTCLDYCSDEGTAMGIFYGSAWCAVATSLGECRDVGLIIRPMVPNCGEEYQEACDPAFDNTSWNWGPTGTECRSYSVGACSIPQDNARELTCTYPQ